MWLGVRKALTLLSRRDRRIIFIICGVQILLSVLDLLGVLLLGIVVALSAQSVSSSPLPSGTFNTIISELPNSVSFIALLAAASGMLLITKSIVGLLVNRRAFKFLANRQALIASELASQVLSRSILDVQRRSSQELSAALLAGVSALTIGTLAPAIIVVAELSLASILVLGMIFVDPIVAIFTFGFFSVLVVLLHIAFAAWSQRLGKRQADADIGSLETIQNTVRAYREVTVSGRRSLFVKTFQDLRWAAARVQADTFVLNQIGKYVFEIGLIIGGSMLIVLVSSTKGLVDGLAILTVFLAGSARIFPSLLRMQTALLNIQNARGTATYTLSLMADLESRRETSHDSSPNPEEIHSAIYSGYPNFVARIQANGICLEYPGAVNKALIDINFLVEEGESLALVGETGSGKSSLADVILGVLNVTSGKILVSNHDPVEAVRLWPGALSYVPQDVAIISGTVRENVALGFSRELVDDSLVIEALERAHLMQFLREARSGLDTVVGENGVQLSGGQRQRIGIARALYSRPKVLVLDEATSALDAETERMITDTLETLEGSVTLVVIAHRLATVRQCTQILYLENGVVAGSGNFDEVRTQVKAFDNQAKLLGL